MDLTYGHPFLTQQLCSHVWERAYDQEPDQCADHDPRGRRRGRTDALDASAKRWSGCGTACPQPSGWWPLRGRGRSQPHHPGGLEHLLHESGVRVVIRELQNAPQLLQESDLIEPRQGRLSLPRRVARRGSPSTSRCSRVQEELDRIEPAAENLYQAALSCTRRTIGPGRRAVAASIRLNPNHVRANQLLADILLAQGKPREARELLSGSTNTSPPPPVPAWYRRCWPWLRRPRARMNN